MKAFFFTKETAIPFLPSIKWYSLFSSFSKATTQSYTLRILLSGTTPYFNTLTDTQVACLYYYTTTAPIIGQSQVSWFKQGGCFLICLDFQDRICSGYIIGRHPWDMFLKGFPLDMRLKVFFRLPLGYKNDFIHCRRIHAYIHHKASPVMRRV